MTSPVRIDTAELNDGKGGKRQVKAGDKVDLLPVNLREQDPEYGDLIAKEAYAEQRSHYGEGSFTIDQLEQWPCGEVDVRLAGERKLGSYIRAYDLMAV